MEKPVWMSQELWDDEMIFAPIIEAYIRERISEMVEQVDAKMADIAEQDLTRKSISA